ncbi:hypothetical protein SOM61_08380 [Massilia sp. CFBP9012]|uniref:hypothetical protein n=1 Tax=Massilia sp. CFBP9012 TaxID=3096531 RepID=UPI002A6AEEF2|nr:hypothetical protein [Massilia sp. CFBP9012]MDY0974976.1 hypothetical protein [Massilia sp. CFBP9012]
MNAAELQKKLAHVPVTNARSYLTSTGWIQQGTIKDVASIWHRPEQGYGDAEILLPDHLDLRDYWQRMMDVISNLAKFEGKLFDQMLKELTLYLCDLVSIRVAHRDVEDGSIPLLDGVALHEHGRDLMIAAAVTTVAKRRHFSGKRPSEANDYLSTLRLGQTGVGSYIVNIIAPVIRTPNAQNDIMDSPFSRVVTANLVEGLKALASLAINANGTEPYSVWDDAISKGASANMCEALIGLSGEKHSREVTVSVGLSKDVEYGNNLTTSITFSPDQVSTLKEMAEYYREKYVRVGYTLRGYVRRLHRDRDSESGTITVTATIGSVDKNVEFELTGDAYKEAIHAHENKQLVSCVGDLDVRPRKVKLLSPLDFKIITNGAFFKQ